jgi:hypothetical protein
MYVEFKTELYYKLLNYSTKGKLYYLWVGLEGRRVFRPDL